MNKPFQDQKLQTISLVFQSLVWICLVNILLSCRPYWKENPNHFLLTKIKAVPEGNYLKKQNFEKVLYPFLNKKVFGFRFYLSLYEWGDYAGLAADIEQKKQKLEKKEIPRQEKYLLKKEKWEKKQFKKMEKDLRKGYDTLGFADKTYKPYTPKKYRATFKEWLTTVVGEAPVLVDSTEIDKGIKKLNNYLYTAGFLKNNIKYELKYNVKKQKARLYYYIFADEPYTFQDLDYDIQDTVLLAHIQKEKAQSLIIPHKNFDFNILEAERKRIFNLLYNKGYYDISTENIVYEADTSMGGHKVNVTLTIYPNKIYKPYYYDQINVYVDVKPNQKQDTNLQLQQYKNYNFYYFPKITAKGEIKDKITYKPDFLIRTIKIKRHELFNNQHINFALNRFTGSNEIGVFQYADVDLLSQNPQQINVDFYLSSTKKNSFMTEINGTIRGENLGATLVLGFTYKNVFRSAEKLNLQFIGGIEARPKITDGASQNKWKNYVPNTFQINPQISLQFPEILFPFSDKIFKQSLFTQTSLLFSYDFQKNPSYLRTNQKVAYFYQWKSGKNNFISHTFTPAEVTYTRFSDKDKAFYDKIELQDQYLKALFQDYLIPVTAYNLTIESGNFSQAKESVIRNYSLFETSGNSFRGIAKQLNLNKDEKGGYQIAGVTFTQYIKFQNDLRYYYNINQKSTFAIRNFIGIIKPFNNSKVIPFERSFYAGGNNDLRGWRNYALGPGSSFDVIQNYDKVADIKILFSAEYRFNIFSYLDMAVFADAGNIWLMDKNEKYKNGEFNWTRFYKEFAFSTGIGLRLNFNNYFIFRVDMAFPFFEPSFFSGEKWIWQSKLQYNQAINTYNINNKASLDKYSYVPNFNIGVGFPF